MAKQGLLLINLGTPEAPTTEAVRRYLREFLSDPRVIDIHPLGRWLLLNLIILPFRPSKSAAAYRKVWTQQGSPLLAHGLGLEQAVAEKLGPTWLVKLGMRYGQPALSDTLRALQDCERVVVLPLYPQYSAASTGSSLDLLYAEAGKYWVTPNLSVIPPFYRDPGFLECMARRGRSLIEQDKPDHILFSYHGLPERQIKKCDRSDSHCLQKPDCCDRIETVNQFCYRAQCYDTTRSLAQLLEISDDRYSVCFQSRLGRTPWIKPYTDEVIPSLLAKGKKRIVVFCPAFVADCLETLEEIGMRAREEFLAKGGEWLTLVPSLNAEADWADAVAQLVLSHDRAQQSGKPTP